jgi:hypothetical protein
VCKTKVILLRWSYGKFTASFPTRKQRSISWLDYLYDQGWFIPIKLPPAAKKAMLAAAA